MKEVRIRKVEDWIVEAFRARAKRHGRSLEGELREFLAEEALRPRRELAERAKVLRQDIQEESGVLPDSAALLREERDAR
jgi:plasmid stability protein